VAVLLAAACAPMASAPPTVPPVPTAPTGDRTRLFDAETVLLDEWRHVPLAGTTDYRIVMHAGRIAIRAVGRSSASALMRRVAVDPARCRWIEWSWNVSRIQETADLRVKDREDVAASVFLLFGDPGFLFDPQPVPTLRYVWTNGRVAPETVVDNPYLPGVVRSIVVRSGAGAAGRWITERRDVAADYRLAFGRAPEGGIHAIALFTDNDQTQEPVEAYYGQGRMACGGP